jgi:hypothetical protein
MTSDLYYKFPDQPTALEALSAAGMTVTSFETKRDELGNIVYRTIQQEAFEVYENEDGELTSRILFDQNGNPTIEEVQIEETEEVERISQGGHDFALWEVGEIEGVEGWHINVRLVNEEFDVSGLEQYRVEPTKPRVVWA